MRKQYLKSFFFLPLPPFIATSVPVQNVRTDGTVRVYPMYTKHGAKDPNSYFVVNSELNKTGDQVM